MSGGVRQSDGSYLGELYRTSGPAFNANPFTPIGPNVTQVGTMRFTFGSGTRARSLTRSMASRIEVDHAASVREPPSRLPVGCSAAGAPDGGRPDTLRKQLRGLPRCARELDQRERDADADAERHRRQRRRDGVPVGAVDCSVAGHRRGTRVGDAAHRRSRRTARHSMQTTVQPATVRSRARPRGARR